MSVQCRGHLPQAVRRSSHSRLRGGQGRAAGVARPGAVARIGDAKAGGGGAEGRVLQQGSQGKMYSTNAINMTPSFVYRIVLHDRKRNNTLHAAQMVGSARATRVQLR